MGIKIGNALDGKSRNAESLIQATGLVGLFGDAYLGAMVIQPHSVGVGYAVLAALFIWQLTVELATGWEEMKHTE